MVKVGLTGNIGSGKSTVARIFEVFGAPVYHSDKRAKGFLLFPEVKNKLKNEFGDIVFAKDEIDRKKLANLVFNDKQAIAFLNSVIHPLVRKDFEDWCSRHSEEPYVVQEAAILFESGFYRFFDKTIVVSCPEEIAVKRVMKRDNATESEVKERMKNQWDQEKKKKLADFIVFNDGEQLIIPQVLQIHKGLRS
ncbi:MAG: dephospho-CoA kinase [Chlorobi bacterium]|nr:dephospho-CoA kinase [Chlorobiota bacterium]